MTTLSSTKVAARTRSTGRRASGRNATSARFNRWAAEDFPWDARDLFRLMWLTAFGLVTIAVCWYGSSGEANFHRQVVWLAAGIGGLLISGFGMAGWLLAGLRNVHRETFEIVDIIRVEQLHQTLDADDYDSEDAAADDDSSGYVIGASMTRVHRRDCPLVKGKSVGPISEEDIERLGLDKCGVCAQ